LRQRSLKRVLTSQWIAFTLALSILFFAVVVLLLFILEDAFIDRRLKDVASAFTDLDTPPALPSQFSYFRMSTLPDDIRLRLHGDRVGRIEEFWRTNGRYVHVLLARTREGAPFVLLYDVTDELTVTSGIQRSLPYVLPLLVVLALCAYGVAGAFVNRVGRQARRMVEQVRASPDPESLRGLAEREPIQELSELARLNAEVWADKLAAVERERNTLAFLGHELRTPLQSARTSLTLLQDERANPEAWHRLRRAVSRLIRASNSILWLSSESTPPAAETAAVGQILAELLEEFSPLAQTKEQVFDLHVEPELTWPLPGDAVETVLANLLLNAIQHGTAGVISIQATRDALTITNPTSSQHEAGGFGIGLQVVQRLVDRFGWEMSCDVYEAQSATRTIRMYAKHQAAQP